MALPMDSQRLGHGLLFSAGLALGFHIWLSRGVFLTLQGDGLEHLFISAGIGSLVVGLLLGLVAVYIVHLLITRVTSRHGATTPTMFSLDDVSWATPLHLFWVSALGFLSVLPGMERALSVLSFFVIDLRWWWTAVIVVTTAFGIYRRIKGVTPFFSYVEIFATHQKTGLTPFLPEIALAVICGLCAVAWTPNLRFSAEAHGDEPRYLRYCENFYQGHGLEISSVQPIADLPSDFNARFGREEALARPVICRGGGLDTVNSGCSLKQ